MLPSFRDPGRGCATIRSVRRRTGSHLADSSGFTMVELLLTLAVMVMLSLAAMPLFTGAMEDYELRLAAEGVANQIRLARSTAMSQGAKVTAIFWNPHKNGETYCHISMKGFYLNERGQEVMMDIGEPYILPANIVFDNGGVDGMISFNYQGVPLHEGNLSAWQVHLCLKSEVNLPPGTKRRYTIITAVHSGRVRIAENSKYDEGEEYKDG